MPDDVPLPPLVDLLWGRTSKARRGPKPELTVDRIVETAISVADADGLAAVSMARVAEELGFTTMSLYRHVPSKDDLLALMAEGATPSPDDLPDARVVGWRAASHAWCLIQWDLLHRRPWLTEVAVPSISMPGPRRLDWIDRGLAALEPTGLDPGTRFALMGLMSQHVLGEARLRLDLARAATAAATAYGLAPEDAAAATNPFAMFDLALSRLADPERYPAVVRAMAEGALEPDGQWQETEQELRAGVEFGLAVLLDGIEALVALAGRGG